MTLRPWAARLYAGGALAAAAAAVAASLLSVSVLWSTAFTAAALALAYQACFEQIRNERRRAQTLADLHIATIEALAGAIDARGHAPPYDIGRAQACAVALARAVGMSYAEIEAVGKIGRAHV